MKHKRLLLILFALVVVVQWLVPLVMIRGSENVLRRGELYRFQTRPVDPVDPFRGRFVALGFLADTYTVDSAVADQFEIGQEVFAILDEDSAGFAIVIGVLDNAPSTKKAFIKAQIDRTMKSGDRVSLKLDFPFERFYMQEFAAIQADELFAEVNDSGQFKAYAEVYVHEGKARLKDVKVNGRSLRELALEEQLK